MCGEVERGKESIWEIWCEMEDTVKVYYLNTRALHSLLFVNQPTKAQL